MPARLKVQQSPFGVIPNVILWINSTNINQEKGIIFRSLILINIARIRNTWNACNRKPNGHSKVMRLAMAAAARLQITQTMIRPPNRPEEAASSLSLSDDADKGLTET